MGGAVRIAPQEQSPKRRVPDSGRPPVTLCGSLAVLFFLCRCAFFTAHYGVFPSMKVLGARLLILCSAHRRPSRMFVENRADILRDDKMAIRFPVGMLLFWLSCHADEGSGHPIRS